MELSLKATVFFGKEFLSEIPAKRESLQKRKKDVKIQENG